MAAFEHPRTYHAIEHTLFVHVFLEQYLMACQIHTMRINALNGLAKREGNIKSSARRIAWF